MEQPVVANPAVRPLRWVFLALVAFATGLSLLGGTALPTAIAYGLVGGVPAFLAVAVVYLALVVEGQRLVRAFRWLFVAAVGAGLVASVVAGDLSGARAGQGVVYGALAFVPVAVVVSLVVLAYRATSRQAILGAA